MPPPRAGMAWRILIDTHDPNLPEHWLALADRVRLRARSSLIVAEAPIASGGLHSGPPAVETIDKLASEAGIAAEWFDVSGKRTIVSAETKIALLEAVGLDVASEAQARESLTRLVDEHRAPPLALLARATPRSAARRAFARYAPRSRRADRARGRRRRRMGRRACGGRAARPARRTLRLRARDRAAEAADRPLPPHRRRRRMRAHHCAAGGLQPQSGVTQTFWRRRSALRAPSRGRGRPRPGDRRLLSARPRRARRRAPPGRPIWA